MQVDMDRIYKTMALEKIPWNSEALPEALGGMVKSGERRPQQLLIWAGRRTRYVSLIFFD